MTLTASADPNEAVAPVSTTTPASTGAQHADAKPEKSPRPYAAPYPCPDGERSDGTGSIGFHPPSTAVPPAANTPAATAIPVRRENPVAKNAGSITDTQHGASSATTPPRNDVSSAVPNKT